MVWRLTRWVLQRTDWGLLKLDTLTVTVSIQLFKRVVLNCLGKLAYTSSKYWPESSRLLYTTKSVMIIKTSSKQSIEIIDTCHSVTIDKGKWSVDGRRY